MPNFDYIMMVCAAGLVWRSLQRRVRLCVVGVVHRTRLFSPVVGVPWPLYVNHLLGVCACVCDSACHIVFTSANSTRRKSSANHLHFILIVPHANDSVGSPNYVRNTSYSGLRLANCQSTDSTADKRTKSRDRTKKKTEYIAVFCCQKQTKPTGNRNRETVQMDRRNYLQLQFA